MMLLNKFLEISHTVGLLPELVQGAGGNTSFKEGKKMYVKATGHLLRNLALNKGYICCDHSRVKKYLSVCKDDGQFDDSIRKATIAKESFGEASIETGMHVLLDKFAIHTHSVYANIFNCMVGGEALLKNIFSGQDILFLPYHNPGLMLAQALVVYKNKKKRLPVIIFLQNHGLITHADDWQKALDWTLEVNEKLKDYLKSRGVYRPFKIKKKVVSFSRHLFPDSVVYAEVNPNDLSPIKRRGFYEVTSGGDFIMSSIESLEGTPMFISDQDVLFIKNMEKEKLRIKMASA